MKRETVGEILMVSRARAGMTQDEIADLLGVTRRTVIHWEEGSSCPTVDMFAKWFNVLGLQPMPFISRAIHQHASTIKKEAPEPEVDAALQEIIGDLDVEYKRKILYCLIAAHGSSVNGAIDMITAHLHAPLRDRINVAAMILSNYKLAQRRGELIYPHEIQPNIRNLEMCIQLATDAAIADKMEYNTDIEEAL